jgi:hypothetical protein
MIQIMFDLDKVYPLYFLIKTFNFFLPRDIAFQGNLVLLSLGEKAI